MMVAGPTNFGEYFVSRKSEVLIDPPSPVRGAVRSPPQYREWIKVALLVPNGGPGIGEGGRESRGGEGEEFPGSCEDVGFPVICNG